MSEQWSPDLVALDEARTTVPSRRSAVQNHDAKGEPYPDGVAAIRNAAYFAHPPDTVFDAEGGKLSISAPTESIRKPSQSAANQGKIFCKNFETLFRHPAVAGARAEFNLLGDPVILKKEEICLTNRRGNITRGSPL